MSAFFVVLGAFCQTGIDGEGRAGGPPFTRRWTVVLDSVADGVGDRVELRRGVVTKQRDGGDANDRDQRNEEGVLDQRGATLVIETGPEPVGEEFERGDHFLLAPYGNGGGGGDDHPRIPGCWLPVDRTIGVTRDD